MILWQNGNNWFPIMRKMFKFLEENTNKLVKCTATTKRGNFPKKIQKEKSENEAELISSVQMLKWPSTGFDSYNHFPKPALGFSILGFIFGLRFWAIQFFCVIYTQFMFLFFWVFVFNNPAKQNVNPFLTLVGVLCCSSRTLTNINRKYFRNKIIQMVVLLVFHV